MNFKQINILTKWYFKNKINYESLLCDYQHKDLWSGNMITNDKNVYVLDYENVGKDYFLYDIFTFMHSEYYINHNVQFLNNYFNGMYDKEFKIIFESRGLIYDISLRKKYFYNYLFTFFCNRFSNSLIITKELIRINKLFSNIKKEKK